jgi:hypothetical protein
MCQPCAFEIILNNDVWEAPRNTDPAQPGLKERKRFTRKRKQYRKCDDRRQFLPSIYYGKAVINTKTKKSIVVKTIKSQCFLTLQKKGFWFSFWVMLLFSGAVYFLHVAGGMGRDVFQMNRPGDYFPLVRWENGVSYFTIFFPFLAVFPAAFVSYDEEQGKSFAFGVIRSSWGVYYAAKAVTAFLAGAVLIWVPFGIHILWNVLTFRDTGNGYDGMAYSVQYFADESAAFEIIYKRHPIGYQILFVALAGVFAGICALFAYCVSLYIKKYKILCVLPLFLLFFATRELEFKGLVLDEYFTFPLGKECIPAMFMVEALLLAAGVLLLAGHVKKKELL